MVDLVALSWLVAVVMVEVEGHLFGVSLRDLTGGQVLLIAFVTAGAYELVPTALRGASLGKALLGLRVARADNGDRPGFTRATLRFFVLYPVVLLGPAGIAVLAVIVAPALMDGRRRGIHDRAAGTVVVRGWRDG